MPKKYTLIVEKDEDGWLVSEVVGLPGCHTQAKTNDELIKRTREAIKAYLLENGKVEHVDSFVGVHHIEV